MRVAITRAQPEALETAERVRALGAAPVLTPLLSIEPVSFNADTTGAQALLFTSANGVRAFAQASADRALPAFVVGDATGAAAHDAGFTDVRSAGGDAHALAALVATTREPQAGKLIHFSGAQIAGDIVAALAQAGFIAERHIAYEARATPVLPEALKQPLDAVLFHSARGAETFVALGAPNSEGLIAACLSPAVAKAAETAPWRRIIVAPAPREDALLTALLQA